MTLEALPGGDLVARGLRDLAAGKADSAEALLVLIGAGRLRGAGLDVPEAPEAPGTAQAEPPEHRLYALLAREDPDSAHGRYNALLRRLVSFERAVECVAR